MADTNGAGNGQIEGATLDLSVGSAWQGLSKHLIAHLYPVVQVGDGDNKRYEKDGNTSVHAPLIEGGEIEYVFNWQSPFESSGTNSKAPALLAMLQSGYLSGLVEMTKTLTGTTSEAQRQEGNKMLDMFKGRTGLTKLNSTQIFSDMPPIKIPIKLYFRAYRDAQLEVEAPLIQLLQWALPQSLSPDGAIVGLMKSTEQQSIKEAAVYALMPSIAPRLVAFQYAGRTYSPMVIESISEPITSPRTSDGHYASLELSMTLATLTALDEADIRKIYFGVTS